MEATWEAGAVRIEVADSGGWRTEGAVRGVVCNAQGHVEQPGHEARVAGQERDRAKKCQEHAFGSTDGAIVPGE